jgi:hypothetical protein
VTSATVCVIGKENEVVAVVDDVSLTDLLWRMDWSESER